MSGHHHNFSSVNGVQAALLWTPCQSVTKPHAEGISSCNEPINYLCFSGQLCFVFCHCVAVAFCCSSPHIYKRKKALFYLLKAWLEVAANDRASKHIRWIIRSAMVTSLITAGIVSDIGPEVNAGFVKIFSCQLQEYKASTLSFSVLLSLSLCCLVPPLFLYHVLLTVLSPMDHWLWLGACLEVTTGKQTHLPSSYPPPLPFCLGPTTHPVINRSQWEVWTLTS